LEAPIHGQTIRDSPPWKVGQGVNVQRMENLFSSIHIYKIPREISDHNPLNISTMQSTPSKSRDFRFELSWLQNHSILDKIRELWGEPTRDKSAMNRVQFKLKKVKNFLKRVELQPFWTDKKKGKNR
jgi:hypothetical protein